MPMLERPPRRRRRATATWALLALACCTAGADEEVVHRERSLYQTILITQEPSRLCMKFTIRDRERNQSCTDPRSPKRMVFTYTRMMMASLLLTPEPGSVFVAGLGGGTLPTALADLLPGARIEIAEIDPAVVQAARTYFGFETDDRLRVHVSDARVFVKRALARGEHYDLVLLDAYSGDYIPEHLMTVEFLAEVRALLAPGGVVAANTFATSILYDHESETYRAVFGEFFNLRLPDSNNRVILASNSPLPTRATLRDNARSWHRRLRAYDVPIASYPSRLSRKVDWDDTKRALTDQYSPANLLRAR